MQPTWLNAVIQEVSSSTKTRPVGEKIVVIDTSKRIAIERSLIDTWFRPHTSTRCFLISNNYSGKFAEGRIPVLLSDFAVERTLPLEIKIEASCAHGREDRVAEALFDGPQPGVVLNGLIDRWVRDYTKPQLAAFIDNYFDRKAFLEAYIASRALKEVGLTLKVSISLNEGSVGRLDSVKVGPASLSVRLKDYDRAHGLKMETELLIDERHKINAILCRLDEAGLTEQVSQHLKRYFAERVTLREFYNEFNKMGFKLGLLNYLNEALKTVGRRVQFIDLDREERGGDSLPLQFYSAQRDLSYKIDEHPEPVIVRNTVQMICRDYASFKISGSPNLDTWISENLEQVVGRVLFGKKYIDLLLDFKPLEREIKNKLRFRAATIGYEIQQLITIPDLEPYKWLENFPITADRTFETSLAKFPVRLDIAVTSRIRTLQDISDYLHRRQNVPSEMKEAMLDQIQESLHEIHPEHFYLRFKFYEKGEPVKQLLERKIREVLVSKFNAEIISVKLEIADTEFTQWFDKLQAEMAEFTVELNPHDPRDEGPVVFRGDFQIESIHPDGWEKLQLVRWDISQIKTQFVKNLQSLMETRRIQDLAYRTPEDAENIRNTVARFARDYVLDKFGLLINIGSVRREITNEEVELKKRSKRVRDKEWDAQVLIEEMRIQEIYKLQQYLIQLRVSGGRATEIAETEEKIAILKAHRPSSITHADERSWQSQLTQADKQSLPPESIKPRSITDGDTQQAEPDAK
jgi:hypothetical protein